MKTERNILIAFILNLSFAVFEFIGGVVFGSIAIRSDALHDIGDAVGIGLSYIFEKKSHKKPCDKYTFGYARYSVLGGLITSLILFIGSIILIYNAINRIIIPREINYDGMIIFALIGAIVNFAAAYFTREGDSINQRAVNLHMLEDVLGWIVVLTGAVFMRFTNLAIIDPLMSIGVAIFILIHALKNIKEVLNLFLLKTPDEIDVNEIKEHVLRLDGIIEVHHVHLWSLDNEGIYATMHIVASGDRKEIKRKVREELYEHGIVHTTLEIEDENEECEKECIIKKAHSHHRHHHHH